MSLEERQPIAGGGSAAGAGNIRLKTEKGKRKQQSEWMIKEVRIKKGGGETRQ